MREMVGGCCVCSDDRGWSENPLVYCDGQSCNVAVHQACYGIVTVPTGPWYCRKCESQERSVKVRCELCPSKYGALKRTDNQGWAHVVCALYIPEVRFGNVTTMEPIQLQLIPPERFNKVCYICEEKGKPANATFGACMQCNKAGCKQQFHVTCAQSLGLLCEEAGNYLDNVKYCGYCQHHYSKLVNFQKKGGNVKTIPPYKPVNDSHNSDSNSEKELEAGAIGGAAGSGPSALKSGSSPSSGKKKSSSSSSSGSKHNSAKSSSSSSSSKSSSSSHQRSVHNSSRSADKLKVPNAKGSKADESAEAEKKETKNEHPENDSGKESRDGKGSKKRKANSRTPTPVAVVQNEVSVVVSATLPNATTATTVTGVTTVGSEKKGPGVGENLAEKPKKPKVDSTQSIIINQPVVALTSISTAKVGSPATAVGETAGGAQQPVPPLPPPAVPSIIQTAAAQQPQPPPSQQQHPSLLVSVPLAGTSLSPRHIVSNQTSVLTPTPATLERSGSTGSGRGTPPTENMMMAGGNSNSGVLTSEMSGGGLKITYERQVDSINTEEDMELELEPTPPTSTEVPAKRGRSHSNDKTERHSRGRKRNTGNNGTTSSMPATASSTTTVLPKRSSRSQTQRISTPPPQPGAFAAISQAQIKDSPPSSPSSESLGATSCSSRSRTKGRKSAPAAVSMNSINSGSSKDSKDVKLFQNGVTSAPHMLGNQLNPNSTMHQKMTDHLSSELEAHSIYNPNEANTNLVGPQMHHRVIQSARASSSGSSTASGSGISSVLGGGSGTIPQTLDQLLERQWEQGSQFLMEQAQHFDIASLLSCLHQLRAENLRLEEHVGSLLQRRDHLLAVNARLAIPLTSQPAAAPPPHPHTVNNIHPSLTTNHADIPRSSRHSSNSANYDRHAEMPSRYAPVENGLPPDSYSQNPHRRSPSGGQPSPTIRHSPVGYSNNGLHRPSSDGRSAPRPQPYSMYERPGPSSQQQMVIRRERERDRDDLYHHGSRPS